MSEMYERLQVARKRAGYEKPADGARAASEAFGIAESTYLGHENGSRSFAHMVPRYAQFFKCDRDWLETGVGSIRPKAKHPVVELFERVPPKDQPEAMRYLEYLASRKP